MPLSGDWIRHAVILCVALAIFLLVAKRCERYAEAASLFVTAAQRATKTLFFSVMGSEMVQFGAGRDSSPAIDGSLSSASLLRLAEGSADLSSLSLSLAISISPWLGSCEPASSITSKRQTSPGDQTRVTTSRSVFAAAVPSPFELVRVDSVPSICGGLFG